MKKILFNGFGLLIKSTKDNKWEVNICPQDEMFIVSEYEYRLIPGVPLPARNHISGERVMKILPELDIFMWGYISAEQNKAMDKAADIISAREDDMDDDVAAEYDFEMQAGDPNPEMDEDDPDQRLDSEMGW